MYTTENQYIKMCFCDLLSLERNVYIWLCNMHSVFAKNGVDGYFRNLFYKVRKNAFHLSIFINLEI